MGSSLIGPQVKLRDALVSSLKFIEMDEHELAWVDGVIAFDTDTMATDSKLPVLSAAEVGPGLTMAVLTSKQRARGHGSTFVGELRPIDFKEVLRAHGIQVQRVPCSTSVSITFQAEFSQGILVCDGGIGIRKDITTGKLHIEGALCKDYFKIRDLLYQQYAIV